MSRTQKPKVLIADDETSIRLMLHTTLKSEGYDVEEAVDGLAALAAIERHCPDVLILDLSMPSIDGIGVLTELKNLRPAQRPRVIVLTAYGSIATAVKATRLGAADFLEKPVSPAEVREAVAAVLIDPACREELPASNFGDDEIPAGGYDVVLDRVRKSIRLARYADAESLLMKAADLAHRDAAYFNLLGALYESRRQWRLARKFFGKAISIDADYQPAKANLRRAIELQRMGRATEPLLLGDESDLWIVRMPPAEERQKNRVH